MPNSNFNPRNAMIAKLLQEGMSGAPVQHWTQGANRVAQALLGGMMMREHDTKEDEYMKLRMNQPGLVPPDTTAPPAQAASVMPSPMPQNVSTPVPQNDPTMTHPPSVIQGANGQPAARPAPPPITFGDGVTGQPGQLPPPGPAPSFNDRFSAATPAPASGVRPVAAQPTAALPARQAPTIAPEMAAHIRQLYATKHPDAIKRADALLAQHGGPEEYSFTVAEGNLFRTGKRSGRAELVADASKQPEAIRIAQAVVANPQAYGYQGADDPRLHRDIQHRISGLTTPGQSVRDAADRSALEEAQGAYITASRLAPAVSSAKAAVMRAPEGIMGPMTATWGRIAAGIGLPVPQGATEAQLLQSITTQIAPLYKLPGPVANYEMSLYMQAAPNLGDTRAANLMKIELFERLRERSGQIMDIMRRHAGSPNLYAELSKLDTPIFTPEEKKRLEAATTASGGSGGAPRSGRTSSGHGWSLD